MRKKIFRILFFICLILVFYLTLLPSEEIRKFNQSSLLRIFFEVDNFDKIVHLIMFCSMTLLLFLAYGVKNLSLIYIPFLISALIEILQGSIKQLHRGADFVDLMANLSGITIAYSLVIFFTGREK